VSVLPRVVAIASADPEFVFAQEDLIPIAQERILGPAWQGEADHAVLLMLEKLLSERRPERGEWGVMMAFGPGLTLETALLRF
jgi:hypothetical protein